MFAKETVHKNKKRSSITSAKKMEHQKRDVKERKLVIKSFKVAPKIPSNFFETTWNSRLLLALDAIHDEKPCEESYERLYRAVEDVVVGNFGSELYEKLRQCLEARTEAVAKELKEKCHQGGSFHKSSHKKTSLGATGNSAGGLSAFSSEEEQFLKFFVDDVWETRVKQMMLIRSLFLYLDRTTATAFTKNASLGASSDAVADSAKGGCRETTTGNNDPKSPLDDDERRRRSGTDAVTTTTTPGSRERSNKESSFKLPLWELSVQQFQKQMDANADVLRKAASGCLRLIEREREGEKIDRTLVKRFTTAMETLKRYGGGSNNSFSSSSFPSAVATSGQRNSKKRSAEEEEEEGRGDDDKSMMMVDDNKQQQLTPKSPPPLLVFNFERLFLENTARFYAKESDKRFGITKKSAAECADYLKHCQTRLNEETLDRAESYLQPQTKLVLTKTVEKALIQDKKLEIIDSSDEMLADSSKVEDLKRLYSLLSRVPDGLKLLRDQFAKRLKFVGQKTVQDEAADCVDVLLRMKSSVDDIVVNAFENQRQFSEGAKVAFEMFINTSKNNRIAELIAKFMDEKLKKGNKTSLSTEKDLDEQLNKAVALFRFIQGKDVFEAFYKKDLAKRLLFSKSASIDAERLVVGKLRSECGANFTTRLEGMFTDVDVSRDVVHRYRNNATNTAASVGGETKADVDMNASVAEGVDEDKSKRTRKKSTSIIKEGGGEALEPLPPKPPMTNRETFSVNILTAGFWPSAAKLDVVLPPELQSLRDDFESYYLENHMAGRGLAWQHSTSTCVLKVKFASGTKELAVSLAQAVIILAFNEDDDDTNDDEQQQQHKQFTYKELKEKTNIPDVELKRTLQSLYGGKYRVLLKTPMSKDIDEAKDAFKFNFNLQEKLVRLKISAIQSSTQASGKKRGDRGENGGDHPTTMEEDENEAVRESVRADRFHQIDAMIVRILKTRKKLPHPELINEVVAKLQFPVNNQDLKKRIESLIDREYVERDKDDRDVYHYVA